MTQLPRQSEEELDRIREEFEEDFWIKRRKEDKIQQDKIKKELYGDDYEDIEDEFLEEGWV